MHKWLVIAFLAVASPQAATAQSGKSGMKMVGLDGSCTRLGYRTIDLTQDCKGSIINSAHADGTTGFLFLTSDTLISFVGDGRRQVQRDDTQTFSPVDAVVFNKNGSTDRISAVGWCEFSDPYKGLPVVIRCIAETEDGRCSGEFLSNGKPPEVIGK